MSGSIGELEPGAGQARGMTAATVPPRDGHGAEHAPTAAPGIETAATDHLPAAARAPSLRRNRDFLVVLLGQGVSALGDSVSFTALPLLVLALTGSGVLMGVVGVLQTLPDLIIGLPAGALADRWDRRRLMLYADLGRAALTALIPLAFWAGLDTMAVILLVTAPINALRVLFLAGFTAAMPNLVGRAQLNAANGYSEAIFSGSFVLGPAVAGLLTAVIGPAPTLAIDAASFLASAVGLSLVRRPLRAEGRRGDTRVLSEIAEGIGYIARERVLRAVVAFWGALGVATAPLVPAVIFYLSVDRRQPSEVVGLVVSGYGLGFLIGSLATARLPARPLGLSMLGGSAVQALVLAAFSVVHLPPLWVLGSFGTGLAGAFVLISYITLRATIPPDELLGRVGSTARTISIGLAPIGLLVGGTLLDRIGGGPTLLLVACASLGITLLASFSRSIRGAGRARKPTGDQRPPPIPY